LEVVNSRCSARKHRAARSPLFLDGRREKIALCATSGEWAYEQKAALIAALVLVTPVLASFSVQAQTSPTNATTNSQLTNSNTANTLGVTTGTPTTSQQQTSNRSPTTGVICIEEMTATFCNVPSGPNTKGYGLGGSGSGSGTGSSGGSGSTGGSASAAASGGGVVNTSSIPACGGFPTANELCN
jgi:hypothetical protein